MKALVPFCFWLAGAALPALGGEALFSETFDDRPTGVLHSRQGWQARRQGGVQVQAKTVYAGPKAAVVETNALVWTTFTNSSATNVWIDFHARVTYPAESGVPVLAGSAAAAFYTGADGRIRAASHDTWVTLNCTLTQGKWYRFSVNLDYQRSVWELHVADDVPNALAIPVATNLAFRTGSTNTHFRAFRIKN